MKKTLVGFLSAWMFIFGLSGCTAAEGKNAGLSLVYGATAALSLLLLIGCVSVVQKKRIWFILLFSSVLVVNIGYTLLSVSTGLEMALMANRLSYLGSVFLPFSMLMILLNVTNTPWKKGLPITLGCLAVAVFLVAASPGILDIYYKEVSFAVVDGVSTLVKVYGPLHPLYMVYLFGYFAAMIWVIVRAFVRKMVNSTAHAVILLSAVLVNIAVWFVEQLLNNDFEMLSVSYIISELFLLGVHLVVKENQRLREIAKQVEMAKNYSARENTAADRMLAQPLEAAFVSAEQMELFVGGLERLTPTETAIYEAYMARVTTKEIMANLNITENTLKYHNKNIYGKLGVTSRKQLLEIHKYIQSVRSNLE